MIFNDPVFDSNSINFTTPIMMYIHVIILECSSEIMTPHNVDFSPPYHVRGCPSWKWFYPYHYAPFASDFKDITKVRNDFDQGTVPFAPLEQLMGVSPLPVASSFRCHGDNS